jgi:hypothetical protein
MIDVTTLEADLYKRPSGEVNWADAINWFSGKSLGYYSYLNEINS